MFGKGKDGTAETDRAPQQQMARASTAGQDAADAVSIISSDMTIVGKIAGDGMVKIFGKVQGELRASTVLIAEGAQVEGDLVAEDLTIGGRVKGTIHANRVKLNGSAVVEGDIFHRSLAIEENARFEGSSKREDTDAPRIPLGRAPTASASAPPAAPVNGNRSPNGAQNGEGSHQTAS